MSEVDWSKSPEGAEFYAQGHFYKIVDGVIFYAIDKSDVVDWIWSLCQSKSIFMQERSYCERPKDWPADDRIDAIAQNGGTGEHYEAHQPKTSVEFLNACIAVQSERGKQYDASGTGERSFAAAASAFNAATGKSLAGSDICLVLAMVKLIRQYSQPDRLHHDSLLDGVSYMRLWAEELTKELSK